MTTPADNKCGDVEPLRHYTEATHSYMRALPSALDVKVSIFSTAMTGALLFTLKAFFDRRSAVGHNDFNGDIFIMIGIVALVVAIGFCLVSLRPRMKGSAVSLFSVVGFATAPSAQAIFDQLRQRSPEELIKQQLLHCHELSNIIMAKAKWFQIAWICGLIGIIFISVGFIL